MERKTAFLSGLHLQELLAKENGKMMLRLEKEYSNTKQVFIGVSFKTFSNMDSERKNLPMETPTKVNIKMVDLMERAYMNGIMEACMKDGLRVEWEKELEKW